MKLTPFSPQDWDLIKRTFQYVKPYKGKFIVVFLCILSSIGFGIVQPLIWGKLLTSLFEKNVELVRQNICLLVVLFVAQSLIAFFQSYLFSVLGQNIVYDLKRDMYDKILHLPVKAFDEMRVGDFISRLHGDASVIAEVVTSRFVTVLVDILRVIIVGITVFSISLPLALITVLSFPISYIIFSKFGKKIRKKNDEIAKLNDNYFSFIQQSFVGIREIIGLGIKKENFVSFLSLASSLKNKSVKISILGIIAQTLSESTNFIMQILVILVGGYLIFIGTLAMQFFIAFTSYAQQFSSSLMNITKLTSNIQQALTSLQRVYALMDNLNYAQTTFGKKHPKDINGEIKFENVSFRYTPNSPILKEISFTIPRNKKVAIVGTSGSGKTTIFNLLLRFYQPENGSIKIDDIELSEFDESSFRSNISIVQQDPFLFNTTIKENLLLAKPMATQEEVYNACKLAYIHDFIMSLPEGYDTKLGENGVNLSGGQKQRIAIARAMLKDSRIILFDEATSSLDNESQYFIRKAINAISKNHTIMIIAHRLFTVIEADEIILIDNGTIAGKGTHPMLIKSNPIYKRLYETELNVIKEISREEVI